MLGAGTLGADRSDTSSLNQRMEPTLRSGVPPGSAFVTRKQEWEFMKAAMGFNGAEGLDRRRILVITGMGGSGKTTLAVEFMKVYGDKYASKVLIDGNSELSMQAGIARHVHSLGLRSTDVSPEDCIDFLERLSPIGPHLIVYDGVDDPNIDLHTFLSPRDRCMFILTSRNRSIGQLSTTTHLELGFMSMEEALELLAYKERPPSTFPEAAPAIAHELGYLPISLWQARNYLYQTKCTGSMYLSKLQEDRRMLLTHSLSFQRDMRYLSIFTALEISYNLLRDEDPLITVATQHHFSASEEESDKTSDDYSRARLLLLEIFCPLGQWDPVILDHMVLSLHNSSLVTVKSTMGTSVLQMHPMVHSWAGDNGKQAAHARADYKHAAILLLSIGVHTMDGTLKQYISNHVQYMSSLRDLLKPEDQLAFQRILDNSETLNDEPGLQDTIVDLGTKPDQTSIPDLVGLVTKTSYRPEFEGTYSAVYQGTYKGQKVAIKTIRFVKSAEATFRKIRRELDIWWRLQHSNILPLFGFIEDDGCGIYDSMISPWAVNGTRLDLFFFTRQKRPLILLKFLDVAKGLEYLHQLNPVIVHADLKPANVLVDSGGNGMICDFGLVRIIKPEVGTGYITSTVHTGTARYLSYELVRSNDSLPTPSSDIHALGCVGMEFIYNKSPYWHIGHNIPNMTYTICCAIVEGTPPARRSKAVVGVTLELWKQLQACWADNPGDRPTAHEICQFLVERGSDIAEELEHRDDLDTDII